jgi:hypothetical protein
MASFVLVTEGITDQVALQSILAGYYQDDDIDVNFLQPLRDATDRSRQQGHAGWELVLEYCAKQENLAEALKFNDYLIVQIDTDCAEHVNFGIPLTVDGVDKPVDQLVEEVRGLIIQKLGEDFYSSHEGRIIFAISVHSLECWLLPIHVADNRKASKTKSCESHLLEALKRKDIEYSKDARCYEDLVKDFEKRKNIEKYRAFNRSFDLFLQSLPEVNQQDKALCS